MIENQPVGKASAGKGGEGLQADLLTGLDAETWLLNRLKNHGVDVYAHGPVFDSLRERVATAIVENRFGLVVVGRHNGKPETYEALFERLFGLKLKDVAKAASALRKAGAQ